MISIAAKGKVATLVRRRYGDGVEHGSGNHPVFEPDGLDGGDLGHQGVDGVKHGDLWLYNELDPGVNCSKGLSNKVGDVDHFRLYL